MKIKDYSKMNYIFNQYLHDKFDTMAREIYFYDDFDFFIDLVLFLNEHFKNGNVRAFILRDINEEYTERILTLAEERKWHRRRKDAHEEFLNMVIKKKVKKKTKSIKDLLG